MHETYCRATANPQKTAHHYVTVSPVEAGVCLSFFEGKNEFGGIKKISIENGVCFVLTGNALRAYRGLPEDQYREKWQSKGQRQSFFLAKVAKNFIHYLDNYGCYRSWNFGQ
jgi:hypothetical protein